MIETTVATNVRKKNANIGTVQLWALTLLVPRNKHAAQVVPQRCFDSELRVVESAVKTIDLIVRIAG